MTEEWIKTLESEIGTDIKTEEETVVVDPQAVIDLMQALERVFRIGVYYPAGHSLCDEAAEQFLDAVDRVVGKSTYLCLEIIGEYLHAQGLELDPEQRGVEHFKGLLNELGVSRVDIDAEISAEDLHAFVTQLLAQRNLVQGALSFQQIEFTSLPPTVRIHQREFLSRADSGEVGAGEGDPTSPSVESLLTSLSKQGLTTEQLVHCRRLLATIPTNLEEQQAVDGTLRVTWSDVEKLLMRTVKLNPQAVWGGGGESKPSPHENLDALANMFVNLGNQDSSEGSQEAIDLLVNLTRRDKTESAEDEPSEETSPQEESPEETPQNKPESKKNADLLKRPEDQQENQTKLLSTLQDLADQSSRQPHHPDDLIQQDHREELSILMQMLDGDQKQPAQVRIQKLLRDNLTVALKDDEWQIVVAGVIRLVKQGDEDHLANAMLMIMDSLRRSEHTNALVLLRDVCLECSPQEITTLWPHVMNEILYSGKRPDPKTFRELCDVAASLAPDNMEQGLTRLQALSALQNKHFAKDFFEPPPRALFPILALLLNTPQAPAIGERLVRGLMRAPPGWIGEAVVPLLGRFHPRHKRFLAELMRRMDDRKPSKLLTESAGRIISEQLPGLSSQERKLPWVPTTIRSISRLPVDGSRKILGEILGARRMLIFPEWPTACREAAREALKDLKSSSE